MKAVLWIIALIAILAGGFYYYRADVGAAPPQLVLATVTRGDVVSTVDATGTLQTVNTVEVGTQVSGTISALGADFNDTVKRGQVVATLDQAIFLSQIQQVEAQVIRLRAEKEKARVQLLDAETKLKRARQLDEAQLMPASDLETAEVATQLAKASLDSADAQLSQTEAALAQARVNLSYTVIHSPVDGIVISRNVDVGQTVSAGLQAPTLFVIARSLDTLELAANVAESDVGRVQAGQGVSFTVDAYPQQTFTGTVKQVRLKPTVVQNVVSYTTIIEVPNPGGRLKPGMTATLSIEVERADDVLRVPAAAMRFKPSDAVLAAYGGGEAEDASGNASPRGNQSPRAPRAASPRAAARAAAAARVPPARGRRRVAADRRQAAAHPRARGAVRRHDDRRARRGAHGRRAGRHERDHGRHHRRDARHHRVAAHADDAAPARRQPGGRQPGRRPLGARAMTSVNVFGIAFEALTRNLLRSALTSLGIIIGVASVIVMMALGDGARQSITSRIQSLGTNVITVSAGSFNQGGVRMGQGAITTLTADDAARHRGGGVERRRGVARPQLAAADRRVRRQLADAGPGHGRRAAARAGVAGGHRLVLRRHEHARAPTRSPSSAPSSATSCSGTTRTRWGRTIRIANQPFRVIGVMGRKGQSAMGQDQDDTVFIPYTTMQKRIQGVQHVSNISVLINEGVKASTATAAIGEVLRRRHKLFPSDQDDFSLRTPEEMAAVLTQTTDTMTYLLASVAAVSLLVGGIGIMNIMLVSVTERTREIGLRRAVGARRRDVLRQFVIEAMALSLAGGAVGVVAGVGGSWAVSQLLNWTTVVSTPAVAMSFGFAALIGVVFGFFPARRAAALNPTEALHYE